LGVEGWILPDPSVEVQVLLSGGTITFTGTYVYPLPLLTDITDIPNDQGRQVRLVWNRSIYDDPLEPITITGYEVYRRQDEIPFAGSRVEEPPAEDSWIAAPLRLDGWDFIETVPAHGYEVYQYVAPTLCDSTVSSGQCWSVFFVSAVTEDPYSYYSSFPDSGYSIDNLAPGVPGNLHFDAPGLLAWEESVDADFDYFTVYGSEIEYLDDSAEVIGYTIDPQMNVAGHDHAFYHVTATDFSGNEGEEATVEAASGTADLDQRPRPFALHPSRPNPGLRMAHISFDLPRTEHARLEIFDVSGRLVETLVDRRLEPGRHTFTWKIRDRSGGFVGSGVYFYRLEAGEFIGLRRLQVVR
jgi:hypothetical protein